MALRSFVLKTMLGKEITIGFPSVRAFSAGSGKSEAFEKSIANWMKVHAVKDAETNSLQALLTKIRTGNFVSGELLNLQLSNKQILESMDRNCLVKVCRSVCVNFMDDAFLRDLIQHKLYMIEEDDRLILDRGLDCLSEDELKQACSARGQTGVLPVDAMRHKMKVWLELSNTNSVPTALLLLMVPRHPSRQLGIELGESSVQALVFDISKISESLDANSHFHQRIFESLTDPTVEKSQPRDPFFFLDILNDIVDKLPLDDATKSEIKAAIAILRIPGVQALVFKAISLGMMAASAIPARVIILKERIKRLRIWKLSSAARRRLKTFIFVSGGCTVVCVALVVAGAYFCSDCT